MPWVLIALVQHHWGDSMSGRCQPVRIFRILLSILVLSGLGWGEGPANPSQHQGLPVDWSHRHILVSNGATLEGRLAVSRDPRMRSLWMARTRALQQAHLSALRGVPVGNPAHRGNQKRFDWSVSLGAGSVAPTMSPAKYSFDINATPSCAADFVVYGLNVPGTASQANLVALNNLYSGNVSGNVGSCGTGAATVMWAYNVSSAGGSILTSPVISLDGKKIAFVESTSTSSIFRVLTYDPCTVSVTQCAGNGASATTPKVPGTGNAASMTSPVTYAAATDTLSSPWIDYHNDVAYVGADNATIYRITGVFYGTPTLDTNFGTTPGVPGITLTNNCASAPATPAKLTSPVQVLGASGGLDTGYLFVGDDTGCLTAIDIASRTVIAAVTVGGHKVNSTIPAVYDPPIVDVSNPNLISVFAISSSSNNATSFGGVSVLNSAAIIQAQLNTTGPTFTAVSGVKLGGGATGTSPVELHAPAFDNNYINNNISGTTGFVYACGTNAASTAPTLYRVGFTAGSPPTMNTAVNGQATISGITGLECSPLTEFANPNLATADLLFLGINGAGSLVERWNISGNMPVSATNFANASGGSSGIIVDNVQLTTQQGSSIYFSTLSNGSSSPCTGVKCAVKLTQNLLQ